MTYAAACSQREDSAEAVAEVCAEVRERLGGAAPDLVFLFTSRVHTRQLPRLGATVSEGLAAKHLLGCTAETVICNAREYEAPPVIAVWAAVLPGAEIETFELQFASTPDGLLCGGIPEPERFDATGLGAAGLGAAGFDPATTRVFLLGDPFTCAVDTMIERFGEEYPGVPIIGGMASGARQPGDNRLFRNGDRVLEGAVGAVVRGGPRVRSIVSQGCRPIGEPLVVTKAQRNIVLELGGRPPLVRFQEIYGVLSERDRELVHQGLHVGVAMTELRERFGRGDFLISNVLGADKESGALAIGNLVRPGQTVQFHVRDHETADEDLRHLLEELEGPRSEAALLFSCNGRGTRLFPAPDHDATTIQETCGPMPLAGLFAQGELGPIGGRNYIHGFTASVALFG